MSVLLYSRNDRIGGVVLFGDEKADDVIPEDDLPLLAEPSPREVAEVLGEVSVIEDPMASDPFRDASAVLAIPHTRSLALSSPLPSPSLSAKLSLPPGILPPHHRDPRCLSRLSHVHFLRSLNRRVFSPSRPPLPQRSLRCSCRRSDWSAATRRRFF